MSRVKWDLDQFKEVQKQQEKAMASTEQVINNARNDLNSMTEEVWEGEDGDMARELLGDLVYKEMPQTWKEIDAINTAIKKAQKTAYESKNFCNEFAQIFKDGSLPSETDSAECSGELLCDRGSCDVLKAAMDAAGKNAANVKRNIETVENILSELETPEAKFDYTSYTEPIKEQAQNVSDRVGVFNKAVVRYETKVTEMDKTLARELMDAIPSIRVTPFDPSTLITNDIIHMKDGDIINWLEAHKKINIAGDLGGAHEQSNIKIYSEKQKPDLSDATNGQFANVNVTNVKTTNNNTTQANVDQNIVDFYNSLPKEIQAVLGDAYEEYSEHIKCTDDGFYYIDISLENILLQNGFNSKDQVCDVRKTEVGSLGDWYIYAVKKEDGTYEYSLVKVRLPEDESGKELGRYGIAVSFTSFDMDSFGESLGNGEMTDDVKKSLGACIYGMVPGLILDAVNAEADPDLLNYFSNSNSDGSYLLASVMVDKMLNSQMNESGEIHLNSTYDEYDDFCKAKLDQLEKMGIYDPETNTLKIDNSDGLSKDEVDSIMCVTTANPDVYSFAAEVQAHAVIYEYAKNFDFINLAKYVDDDSIQKAADFMMENSGLIATIANDPIKLSLVISAAVAGALIARNKVMGSTVKADEGVGESATDSKFPEDEFKDWQGDDVGEFYGKQRDNNENDAYDYYNE